MRGSAVVAVVMVGAALAAGYLLGRLRPWVRLGDWVVDQIRYEGSWVRAGRAGQAVVLLVHGLIAPRATWQFIRRGPRAPIGRPERDPDWVAHRTGGDTKEQR